MEKIRTIIADDRQLVLDGLQCIFNNVPDIDVIYQDKGHDLPASIREYRVNVLLLHTRIDHLHPSKLIREIKEHHPHVKILAYGKDLSPEEGKQLLQAGSNGFLHSNAFKEDLIGAVRKVAQGKTFIPEDHKLPHASTHASFSNPRDKFTRREIEVLKLIAEGLSNKEVGLKLHISHRTVDTHRTNIMKKIGTNNLAGLIRFALKNGYTD